MQHLFISRVIKINMLYTDTPQSHDKIQIWYEQRKKSFSSTQVHVYSGHTGSNFKSDLVGGGGWGWGQQLQKTAQLERSGYQNKSSNLGKGGFPQRVKADFPSD